VAIEIHPYRQAPASYGDYDADVVDAALALADGICLQDSRLRVEHIGSTAVPGCGGKGYIDLLLMYPDGHLDAAKAALETLGFGRQSSRDPFPEDRPMRVGAVVHEGRRFPVHVHVIAATAPEAAELLWFRDRLRGDETLRAAYEAEKRRIVAAGVTDGVDYSNAKASFIEGVLARRRRCTTVPS